MSNFFTVRLSVLSGFGGLGGRSRHHLYPNFAMGSPLSGSTVRGGGKATHPIFKYTCKFVLLGKHHQEPIIGS